MEVQSQVNLQQVLAALRLEMMKMPHPVSMFTKSRHLRNPHTFKSLPETDVSGMYDSMHAVSISFAQPKNRLTATQE